MGTALAKALAGLESKKPDTEEDEEFECSDELKLATYELLDAFGVGYGSDGERVGKAAKALAAFIQLVDAMPHAEGSHTSESKSY